jgi:hypothetical protein
MDARVVGSPRAAAVMEIAATIGIIEMRRGCV